MRAEPVRPARHQRGALQRELGVVDRGDVEDDRAGRGASAWSSAAENISPSRPRPSRPISVTSEVLGDVAVAVDVAAVQRDLAQLVGRVLDDLMRSCEHRDAVVALVEDADRAVEDRLLAVGRRAVRSDRDQRCDHRVAAAARVGEDLLRAPGRSGARRRRSPRRGRGCSAAAAAAELDDLAAERRDQVDVVGLEVAEDQRHARRSRSARAPSGARGRSCPGRACRARSSDGLRDQVGALEPGDRVARTASRRRAGCARAARRPSASPCRPRTATGRTT